MVKPKPKLKDFVPQRLNANDHTERGMRMLAQSIEKNGVIGAMTVAANGETFDGSATWETCVQTFGEDVEPIVIRSDGSRPVIHIREDLETADDPRAIELGIAANRVAEMKLSYNLDVLSEIGKDIDLSSMIYPNDHLNELLESLGKGGVVGFTEPKEEDEEEVAELLDKVDEIESRVKLGEIWQLGRHKLCCSDSTVEKNVRALLGDRFDDVGMVWSDSPYGISIVTTNVSVGGGEAYDIPFGGTKNETPEQREKRLERKRLGTVGGSKPFGSNDVRGTVGSSNIVEANKYAPIIGDDTIETARKSFEVCKLFPDSIQFWWGSNYYDFLPPSSCWIVWDKENTGNFADAELAWCNHKSAVRIFKHQWNGMIKASERGEKRVHPTQKPVALCEWCFEKYGKDDDLIFDPFLGSAPSIIAAQKMEGDRTVYGFELSPQYCTIILERFQRFTGIEPKLVGRLPD